MSRPLPPGVSPNDDASILVERIARGDTAAEDEFVRTFEHDVLRLLRGRTRDHEASRELADDVLMAVVSALRAGRLQDAAKLRAFVRGTARNIANNYLRTRFARPPEEPLDREVAAARPADGLEQQERIAFLHRNLLQLAGADRQILLLTMIDGLKPGEIAHRLGLSPETVRTRKSRALQRLIARVRRSDA
jgi:RNA polymerase sigma-70 factor, ECF subfamily